MHKRFRQYQLLFFLLLSGFVADAQFLLSGTVYDSTKTQPVKNVQVISTNGNRVMTDSVGHYAIFVNDSDSICFQYNNKPTAKFPVKGINNIGAFDISLHVRVAERFKTLKEVRVFTKNYRQDSIENRMAYSKLFNYQKPGISSTSSGYSGAAGLDLDEFINIFRFRRNRQMKYMQTRLLEQEQENFIKYRFNKALVKRITRLEDPALDSFMVVYRPDFEFTRNSATVDFYQYILDASYRFKRELLIQSGKIEGR